MKGLQKFTSDWDIAKFLNKAIPEWMDLMKGIFKPKDSSGCIFLFDKEEDLNQFTDLVSQL